MPLAYPLLSDQDTLCNYYFPVPNAKTLVVYLRGLDQAMLVTNLHSAMLPKKLRAHQYYTKEGYSFLRLDLLGFEDLIPFISSKKHGPSLLKWKKEWRSFFTELYKSCLQPSFATTNTERCEEWITNPDKFLKRYENEFLVPEQLQQFKTEVKERLKRLLYLREKLYKDPTFFYNRAKSVLDKILLLHPHQDLILIGSNGASDTALLLSANSNYKIKELILTNPRSISLLPKDTSNICCCITDDLTAKLLAQHYNKEDYDSTIRSLLMKSLKRYYKIPSFYQYDKNLDRFRSGLLELIYTTIQIVPETQAIKDGASSGGGEV